MERRHGDMWGVALPECSPECGDMCVCDGEPCEHWATSFLEDGSRYCVDCYQPLDEEDED